MTEQEMKNRIEELETELQQYKTLVFEIKEYIKGYDIFVYLHSLFENFGF